MDFTSIRDRVVGILLGLTVSSAVYRFIWPERATDKLRTVFARALRHIGQLLRRSPDVAASKPSRELYESIITDLAETQQLIESANFEEQDDRTAAVLASTQPRAMVRHAQEICLTAGQLLGRSLRDGWQTLAEAERTEDEDVRKTAAETLERVKHFVEHGGRAPVPSAADDREWPPGAGNRASLRRRLLEECELFVRNCRTANRTRTIVRRSS